MDDGEFKRRLETPDTKIEDIEQSLRELDQRLHASVGRFTGGLSPLALSMAYYDWLTHLITSPSKLAELWQAASKNSCAANAEYPFITFDLNESTPVEKCSPYGLEDRRFQDPLWQKFPHNLYVSMFLNAQDWWRKATSEVPGLSEKNQQIVSFMARQSLDMISPSNSALLNPVVLNRTFKESGANFIRGAKLFKEDLDRLTGAKPRSMDGFHVGKNVACTAGKVVFRNELIELLHYDAVTEEVRKEPILIVPAWIMKYYILDLSSHNSLVKYLTEQGYSVFIISWKNPSKKDQNLSLDDYRELGIRAAINEVNRRLPKTGIHMAGYCLGGTLLAIEAAFLAKKKHIPINSISLFAAQVDFADAGELTLFINESQLAFLENIMREQGYLKAEQMAGAFQMLRSNDLIWSRVIRHYLLGERTKMNDLMAWNADSTRMPAKMHSEYLNKLFLNNDLAQRRLKVDGSAVSLSDIRQPIFAVGTEQDHVSPWKSVYKINALTDTDVTFVLTNRGHNAGVVSEPGHKGRHFRSGVKNEGDLHISAEKWLEQHPVQEGSWWPAWISWLNERSSSECVDAADRQSRLFEDAIGDAPGTYVLQR
ncbi:alpha/beta fold hydrolase [Lentilitoribacter sp. Alg239-R112]|uniref:PHA/PHB synthase family protein n=1 Tax=Lentilitoribacter sp. Alg239-R112 TaxID=2305987 RepID=UPI0013A6AA2D|nr:alpha/beta fold hydrolase [Lentilitoribacter sp. Alg239-R112]